MAMITFEDLTGTSAAVIFPGDFKKYGRLVDPHRVVFLFGRVDLVRQEPNIKISRIVAVEDAPKEFADAVEITLQCDEHGEETLAAIDTVLRGHAGGSRVTLVFDEGEGRSTLFRVADTVRVSADDAFIRETEEIVGAGNVKRLETRRGNGEAARAPGKYAFDAGEYDG